MNNTINDHKWYRIEMTATGQVYAREVRTTAGLRASEPGIPKLVAKNVGRYTCSCAVGHL